uniref:Hemopexin n=1 Tax=Cynoglossus semilaevis TaxID=244447 RepID=A0A3P8W2A9_CYNSE
MDLLTKTLLVCLALGLTTAAPASAEKGVAERPDRCEGVEFDAITLDENGTTHFFKGDYVWKGYHGEAQLTSKVFRDMNGHVDAAFRMHHSDNPDLHDHVFFFQDDKVFIYDNHTLEDGYPKTIQEVFPGVPDHLDAAVECPKGECNTDFILFFKDHEVYFFDLSTKTVKNKTWTHLPVCTSVLRWLEHYYCFHGNNFTRFNPVSGLVEEGYPKDARNYFMKCPNFGHGGKYSVPKCSEVKLDAVTMDDAGKKYFFAGRVYMRLDTSRDGLHGFPIARSWKEVANGVDAVFSYTDKLYMIKDNQVYIYKGRAHYTLIEGYPKTLKEELGIEGSVDAAFVCPGQDSVFIIQGRNMLRIDLTATPRVVNEDFPLPLFELDAGFCGPNGINVFKGSHYYEYKSPMLFALSKMVPRPLDITPEMMGCEA